MRAYNNYINGDVKEESQMRYDKYLDYWMKEYSEINFKYSTAKRYKKSFDKIKEELGRYRLCELTPYILKQALLKEIQQEICKYQKYYI